MSATSNFNEKNLPGFTNACGLYQTIEASNASPSELEKIQKYNNYAKCCKVSNYCGYVPGCGSAIGAGRITYVIACCIQHYFGSQTQYNEAQNSSFKSFYAGHCVRSIPELASIGCFLICIDDEITIARKQQDPTGGLCPSACIKPLTPTMEDRTLLHVNIATNSPLKDF